MKIKPLLGTLLLLGGMAFGQQFSGGGSAGNGVTITNIAGLASVPQLKKGTIAVITDGSTATDCTVGGGTNVVTCQYNGTTWGQLPAASAGATAFSAITGATNAAALVMGTGGSLTTSGTGTISATQSAALSVSGQTGLLTFTGITATNRAKTVRDAADTILELGGGYTPTGTWNWTSCSSCTWPTFNQNTTGSAGSVALGGITGLGTGVATFLGTPSSANLFAAVTGSTGSGGGLVFATSPVLTTPNLGTPSAVTLTNATGLPLAGLSFTSTANTLLGTTAAATSPSLISMPSCSGATSALIWTTGTGIGCNTISTLANPMTTLGDIIYGGVAGAVTRLAGPTGVNSVPQFLESVPSAGAATAPVWSVSGVTPNAQTGTTYTFLATDRNGYTTFNNAASIAVTLPQANSTGFASNYVTRACDIGAGTATITPTTSTISYTNGSAYTSGATSMALTTGQCATIFSDNTNYFANVATGGGSGTVTHTAGALTSNQLVLGNGTADVKVDPSAETDGAGNLTALSGTFQKIRNTFYASQWCNTPGTLDYTCIGNASRQAATAGGGTVVVDPVSSSNATYTVSQDLAIAGCAISSWSLTTNVVAVTVKAAGSCHLVAGNKVTISNAAIGGASVNINNGLASNPVFWTIAASPAPVDPTGAATGSFSFAMTAANDSSATAVGVVDTKQPITWQVQPGVSLSVSDTNGAGHSAICMTEASTLKFPNYILGVQSSYTYAGMIASSANLDSFVTPCNNTGDQQGFTLDNVLISGDAGSSTVYQGVLWLPQAFTGSIVNGALVTGFKGNTANAQPVRGVYLGGGNASGGAQNSVFALNRVAVNCGGNAGCVPFYASPVGGRANFDIDIQRLDLEHAGQQTWSSVTATDSAGTVTFSGLTAPVFAFAGEQFIVSGCTGGTNLNGTYNGASAVATVSTTSFTATALSGASGTGTSCTVLLTPPAMFVDGNGSNNSIGNNANWNITTAYFEGQSTNGNNIGVEFHNGSHDIHFGSLSCAAGTGTGNVCLQRDGPTTPLRISVDTLYAHSTEYGTCINDLVNTSNSVPCGSSGAQGVSPWFSDGPTVFGGNVAIDGATVSLSGLASLPVSGNYGLQVSSTGAVTPTGYSPTAIPAADIAAGQLGSGVQNSASLNLTGTVASGTATMGTGAITSGTCATVVTVAATGVATTDTIAATPNTDPTAVTGYAPSASGSLYIQAYPTANNVNFRVCNNTSGSITPSALTLNWRVSR